ncbi:hypothetical protein [Candidatus Clostridium radicumherbarum]|uniref:DUF1871 domain-containing protein n=1 Tax=Candidatus Clostridium radicumherbarum TaxID=3381662 RepID=A0ABW8TLG9_9CLOT
MKLYDKIEKIINEWDPIDLLPIFPPDEYRDEILEIIELLKDARDKDEISKGIKKYFLITLGNMCLKRHVKNA